MHYNNYTDRTTLPVIVSRRMPYRIVNGRLYSEACEISIVENCNFTCRSCSHLSPVMPRHALDPEDIARDLGLLAHHYQVEHVRLVGGEPFLHPRLSDVIKAVRESGITSRIRVITNGSLPNRMTTNLWSAIDEVHVSIYPGQGPTEETIGLFKQMATQHGTDLVIKRFDRFRESYSEIGTENDELVSRVYQSCQIAHIWRCHTVRRGYFYRCPQSIFVSRVIRGGEPHPEDALPITNCPNFGEQLLAFLEQPHPLNACRHCLGSVGDLFDHEQVSRSAWR